MRGERGAREGKGREGRGGEGMGGEGGRGKGSQARQGKARQEEEAAEGDERGMSRKRARGWHAGVVEAACATSCGYYRGATTPAQRGINPMLSRALLTQL